MVYDRIASRLFRLLGVHFEQRCATGVFVLLFSDSIAVFFVLEENSGHPVCFGNHIIGYHGDSSYEAEGYSRPEGGIADIRFLDTLYQQNYQTMPRLNPMSEISGEAHVPLVQIQMNELWMLMN